MEKKISGTLTAPGLVQPTSEQLAQGVEWVSTYLRAQREYYLTDMIAILIGAGKRVVASKIADSNELLGINNRLELASGQRAV